MIWTGWPLESLILKVVPSSSYLSASLPNEDVRSHSSSAILNSRSTDGRSHSFKISPIAASQYVQVFHGLLLPNTVYGRQQYLMYSYSVHSDRKVGIVQ